MSVPPGDRRWTADVALGTVAFIWGTTFVLIKAALPQISTLFFLACRFFVAATFMLLFFLPGLRRLDRAGLMRGLRGGAITGLFLWVGYVLQTFGLKYTSAGNSGFITGLYIVLVPLLLATLFRRLPQGREVAGFATATCGMVIMTLPDIGGDFKLNIGDLLTAGCALSFAGQIIALAHFSKREDVRAVALGQIAASALLSIVSLPLEPPRVRWSFFVVCAIAIASLIATALAFVMQTWGQKHTTATRAALLFSLEPVFALVTAVVIGHEPLRGTSLLGGGMILLGILLVELKPVGNSDRE